MKRNKLALAICCIGTLTLYGCGDSDGPTETTSPTVETQTYEITAIDGYLQNATVWLDINTNYSQDSGEPTGFSDETGVVNLDVTDVDNYENYPVVVQAIAGQTIDLDNPGVTVSSGFVMSAPAGETAVTPLSTLVHVILEQKVSNSGTTLTADEIEALKDEATQEVGDLLGLSADEVLGDFIEQGTEDVKFAAENIVAANILPESPEEMAEEVDAAKNDDPDDMDDEPSGLLAKTDAAAVVIKEKVDETNGNGGDFTVVEPVFNGTEDGDVDSDSDGVPDYLDAFDFDSLEWADANDDGYGDNLFDDRDGDTILSHSDNCLSEPNLDQADLDGDEIGDVCDTDKDGDSVLNDIDNCPINANASQLDGDGDSIGDACDDTDNDIDRDGVFNVSDNCPLVANVDQLNTDGDSDGDACDSDKDDDGVENDIDNCPIVSNVGQLDGDGDGIGDECDSTDNDVDRDGIFNDVDNCPSVVNSDQADLDGDLLGDECDTDKDGDTIVNDMDNCPINSNLDQLNTDGDSEGDACDDDIDGDTVLNGVDNCPLVSNIDQTDDDSDGVGLACDDDDTDTDVDDDNVLNDVDNCVNDANEDQSDIDNDGIGDVCDATTEMVWNNTNWNDSNWQ